MPTRLFRSARNDRNRFVALYVLLVLGLLIAAGAFLYEARVIIRNGAFEDRTFTVLRTTNRVLDDLQDAETGQRGYLLTGSAAYLQPYERGTRDIAEAMRELHSVIDGDAASIPIVRRIDVLQRQKLDELARTLDLSRGGDWREAIALVQTDEGKRAMDVFRIELNRLRGLWETRRQAAARDARERVIFGAGALALLAVFVGGLLAYALVVQRRAFANISAYSEAMDRQAACDPLTGLPNRRRLLAAVDALAAGPASGPSKVALLYLDVDGFKSINDALGHSAGDAFLRRVAKWLSAVMRREDLLARVGGDEFVALVTDYGDDDLRGLARRLIEQVRAVAQVEYAGRFQIGLSIGIATYPDRVAQIRDLIDVADAAMYAAKRDRSLFRFGPVTANDHAFGVRASH
ncbi:sensor domain-containing diguanylate cyclase [Trinickia diaoshuihuensis]|uniref:GGDEF domain-containing protein n=1 Tax=Trinickia diaoshuihuensis TaxID=2292265 RepID=UPI000E258A8E|nr:diguanylate cyclase [Trinickia diaoshuihuensis]